MAKGQPDFGALAPTETIVGLSDLGELAARLGSPVIFHRSGNVIFIDSFSSLAKTANWGYSAPGSVKISNLYGQYDDFSCELTTPAATNGWAQIYYALAYPVLSKMGFEFSWNRCDSNRLQYIKLYIELYDGANIYEAEIRWVASTQAWQYKDSGDNLVDLTPTVDYGYGFSTFNHAKLIIDAINHKYDKLIVNNLVYDLSGIDLYSGANNTPAFILVYIHTRTNQNAAAVNYIEDLIITQNEP